MDSSFKYISCRKHDKNKEVYSDGKKVTALPTKLYDTVLSESNSKFNINSSFIQPFKEGLQIIEVIKNIVSKYPKKIAINVSDIDVNITYEQLWSMSSPIEKINNQVFDMKGRVVAIDTTRIEMIPVYQLQVLRSGGVYLTIDRSLGKKEIERRMKESNVSVVLGSSLDVEENQFRLPFPGYIIFTSGSTGSPNAVYIQLSSLNSFIETSMNLFCLNEYDTLLQFASVSFDASVWEIWTALTSGSTLAMVSNRELILPGYNLYKFIVDNKISIMLLPPSVLSTLNEWIDDMISLKIIVSGGEALSSSLARYWSKNISIWNAYGPTECTVAVTFHKYNNENVVPLGTAYGCNIHIEDEEILISGQCLAHSYINNKILTNERFIIHSLYGRCYRTKDKGELNNGLLYFKGRLDNQVKIRGFRVELEGIETIIGTHPDIGACCTVAKYDIIICFYIAKQDIDIGSFLKDKLPKYSIPSKYIRLSSLPLKSNGSKVDRNALLFHKDIDININQQNENEISIDNNNIISVYREVTKSKMNMDDNFFENGGTSLSASFLSRKLSIFLGKEIPIGAIFEYPIPNEFIENVDNLKKKESFRHDINIQSKEYIHGNKIFITGATGFLGSYLLAEILFNTSKDVITICRGDPHKVINKLKDLDKWNDAYNDRLHCLSGDLSLCKFGLNNDDWRYLCDNVSTIYNLASDISYILPYNKSKINNVYSVEGILELASHGNKIIHHVSSMGIFGACYFFKGLDTVTEKSDIMEVEDSLYPENGYTKSKWTADYIMLNARKRGFKVWIYRPGFITASSKGKLVYNATDFLCRYIKGCVQMGMYPDLPQKYWLITPVDYCAEAIYHISTSESEGIFHLNCRRDTELSNNEIFELIQDNKPKKVSYKEWVSKVSTLYDTNNHMVPVIPFIVSKAYNELTMLELHSITPTCNSSYTESLLKKYNISCVPFDNNLFKRYMIGLFYELPHSHQN